MQREDIYVILIVIFVSSNMQKNQMQCVKYDRDLFW